MKSEVSGARAVYNPETSFSGRLSYSKSTAPSLHLLKRGNGSASKQFLYLRDEGKLV